MVTLVAGIVVTVVVGGQDEVSVLARSMTCWTLPTLTPERPGDHPVRRPVDVGPEHRGPAPLGVVQHLRPGQPDQVGLGLRLGQRILASGVRVMRRLA